MTYNQWEFKLGGISSKDYQENARIITLTNENEDLKKKFADGKLSKTEFELNIDKNNRLIASIKQEIVRKMFHKRGGGGCGGGCGGSGVKNHMLQ